MMHQFAFFLSNLSTLCATTSENNILNISGHDLVHRITRILRIVLGDICIFFDQKKHAHVTITAIEKNNITVRINSLEINKNHMPLLTLYLPVLKKDALEEAINHATQLGVNAIQLVITHKIYQTTINNHYLERLRTIIINAAEQSKHFAFPVLHEPISFSEMLKQLASYDECLFCDPEGQEMTHFVDQCNKTKPHSIALLVGPEGDLTEEEKLLLRECAVSFYRLTPTILRTQEASSLVIGIIRTFLL